MATLYGAYAFIEKLGVRFSLDGDVIPDERIEFRIPDLDDAAHPLFALRGIQPFHDFAEGPDWWNEDDYKMILGQLPKLRMNFFGLHTYPENNPNAEPGVWIGLPGEFAPDGRVTAGYPSSWQNTLRSNSWSHNWGYQPKPTSRFSFGAAGFFDRDDYGPEVMAGLMPEPRTPGDSVALFNRAAEMLRGAFTFGRNLGVKICVGTETPLTVPADVRERLKKAGKDFPRSGGRQGALQGRIRTDPGRVPDRLLLALDKRELDVVRCVRKRYPSRDDRFGPGPGGRRGNPGRRSAWRLAAGFSAPRAGGRSSTKSCPKRRP